MCTRYITPEVAAVERHWEISRQRPNRWWNADIHPLRDGPFVLAGGVLHVGQWGLIPPGSATRVPALPNGKRLSTVNARRERVASAPTYREAWRLGQRCLIPAQSFDEPNWASGKNVWWRFAKADGAPLALAGLWSQWADPESGELVHSYTMLTQNCDAHPVLGLMHKPDPKLPADQQDKRTVVPLERADWNIWLEGSEQEARALIRLPGADYYAHGAVQPVPPVQVEPSLF